MHRELIFYFVKMRRAPTRTLVLSPPLRLIIILARISCDTLGCGRWVAKLAASKPITIEAKAMASSESQGDSIKMENSE